MPSSQFPVCAIATAISLLALCPAPAQDPVPLFSQKDIAAGWSFGNGPEFPGATGGLTVDAETRHDGHESLKLAGDFNKGGNYVQAGRNIDRVDIRELSVWVRSPESDHLTLRLNDASGQTHQIVLKTEISPDWQHLVLPLERFFARRGEADAVTNIAKYESWGGAKDGKWHGPATALYVLVGRSGERKTATVWLSDLSVLPRPTEVPGADVISEVRLDEIAEGQHDWRFSKGDEFRGAQGSLSVVKDTPAAGQSSLRLAGDFTGGGAYVAAVKDLKDIEAKDVREFRLRVRSDSATSIGIQLVDGTGQTHQRKDMPVTADGQWHDMVISPTAIAGGEHWGGAKDGKWHGPPTLLALSLSDRSDSKAKKPVLDLAQIRAEALLSVFVQPAAFKCDFEEPALPSGWQITDGVSIDPKDAFKGNGALRLSRTVDKAETACSATSPVFHAAPGQWQINLACKSGLSSPDSSYNGVVQLECLDGADKVIDRITLADTFGMHPWSAIDKRVELPRGVVSARIHVQLNKSWGSFWVDSISASYLAPSPRRGDRVSRILFASAQLGNLLFPTDSRKFQVTVEAHKPLRDDQHTLTCVVRDYWGAEQIRPLQVSLGSMEKKGDRLTYEATVDLASAPLEVGRYYELHASIPQQGGESFHHSTSFAILPEAETRKYPPDEVPFTSRNWDNRFPEYVKLTDRLGVRICGIWGGWSPNPPYKAEAPTLDLCAKLGMGWLTGTPIATIERGKNEYDEKALREGVRNLISQFGKVRPMVINLGNEPHGTGDRVLANVAAYRAVYEEAKKTDPTIPVVATSVEPNEEYFKAGYGKWCDAYDFHIYESAEDVRKSIHQYQELMKKYDVVKPIWSTELGLNSQGMTRQVVAREVIKKFTTFFAAGGVKVSWFGLLYPDSDGKSYGSSGDSHNVFDCRFNRYCPRLDAIAYYNGVNGISIKKFTCEKQYAGGISAFLFQDRDQRSLQVLWKDKGRADVSVPLSGVQNVQVIRIDGSRHELHAGGKGITITVTEDPILLLYQGGPATLAETLGAPAATLAAPPASIARHGATTLEVQRGAGASGEIGLVAPPFWTVAKAPAASAARFMLTPPTESSIREADLVFTIGDPSGGSSGELLYRAPVPE